MKKLIFTAVITAFVFSNLHAQEVQFGVKGGANFATYRGDDSDDLDHETSFHAGILAEIKLAEQFSVQPELLYSRQGAKYEQTERIDEFVVEGKITDELQYIHIPLMAKFYVLDGLSLEAGPQVGFLVAGERAVKGSVNGTSGSEKFDLKDTTNTVDFGVNFGVGYKFENGFGLGARYNLGITNLPEEDDVDWQNSVYQVSLAYFF